MCFVASRLQKIILICLMGVICLNIRGFLVMESAGSPVMETTRSLSWLVRPWEDTVLVSPVPGLCDGTSQVRLIIAVFSAPANIQARSAIRLGDLIHL